MISVEYMYYFSLISYAVLIAHRALWAVIEVYGAGDLHWCAELFLIEFSGGFVTTQVVLPFPKF